MIRIKTFLITLACCAVMPAVASAQTITIVNDSGLSGTTVSRIVNAGVQAANNPLRSWWNTPWVSTGSGGWVITFKLYRDTCSSPCDGYHGVNSYGHPYAHVFTYGRTFGTVSTIFSHELDEMMVDPYLRRYWPNENWPRLLEVADPVQNPQIPYDNAYVSDFATPHWAGWSYGPYDWQRLLSRAWQTL